VIDVMNWFNRSIIGYATPLELMVTPLVFIAFVVLSWLWWEARADRWANELDWHLHPQDGGRVSYLLRRAAAEDAVNSARARWFALLFLLLLCVVGLFTPDGVRGQVQLFFILYELFALSVTSMLFYSALYSFRARRRLGNLIRSRVAKHEQQQQQQ
jgi:hypothetical protein